MDFRYCEEANVFHQNLDSFLAISEEFQLNGLIGEGDFKEPLLPPSPVISLKRNAPYAPFKREISGTKVQSPEDNRTISVPSYFSGDLEEFEEKKQVKTILQIQMANLIFAKYVEMKARAAPSKITLKQIIWKEFNIPGESFVTEIAGAPAISVTKLSNCELPRDTTKLNFITVLFDQIFSLWAKLSKIKAGF